MSEQDIINVVDPIAAKYGVPTFVWETVAEVESGLNPRAVGDNGSSFGLFQLHRGGQLGNLTQEQAFDPATNAEQAMPAIAAAWKKLNKGIGGPSLLNGNQYPGTLNWWYQFASLSGHPGMDSGAANSPTQVEAQKLQQEASYLSSHPLAKPGNTNNNTADRQPYDTSGSGDCSAWNPFTYGNCINNYVQDTYVKPLEQGAIKVGIFLLALLLVIAGLWAISRG